MVVKIYLSGISGNKEVKKRQQRVTLILDSKNIKYEVIDIAEPGNEEKKDFMQNKSTYLGGTVSDPTPRHPLPPQIFNDEEYCGDYDQFDLANELDEMEKFLKIAPPDDNISNAEIKLGNGVANEKQENGTADNEKDASPVKEIEKEASPVKDSSKEASPVKGDEKEASPAKEVQKEESPAKDSVKEDSPAKESVKEDSPAKDSIKEASPVKETEDQSENVEEKNGSGDQKSDKVENGNEEKEEDEASEEES